MWARSRKETCSIARSLPNRPQIQPADLIYSDHFSMVFSQVRREAIASLHFVEANMTASLLVPSCDLRTPARDELIHVVCTSPDELHVLRDE
jgi:hypothetical protein